MIIGNNGTSLMRYEENDGVFRTVLNGEDIGDYILHAMFSPNGELWLGCMNSLRCFNALTMTERESVPLEDGSASNCCMLPDGRIFISAYGRDLRVYNSLTHRYKLNRAAQLLREHKYNMSEIADMTGFATLSQFSTSFKKQFGVPPSEY